MKQFLVYGGQGDRAKFFNDVWLYDLDKRLWQPVTVSGTPLPPLAEHCSGLVDNKLYMYATTLSRHSKSLSILH